MGAARGCEGLSRGCENKGESDKLAGGKTQTHRAQGGGMQPAKGEITLLLAKWKDGEPSAFEELMPLVYPHLREVAAAYVRRERNPDVLQATALVHELYLRLLNQKKAAWDDRRHFYTFAAKVMRMILSTTRAATWPRCAAETCSGCRSRTISPGSISAARNSSI